MKLLDFINYDFNNLHNYSNVDVSTIIFDSLSCMYLAKQEYAIIDKFIDMFDDVTKLEAPRGEGETGSAYLTFSENILYVIYNTYFVCNLTDHQKMKILFKLLERGFHKSKFHAIQKGMFFSVNHILRDNHIPYFVKYYDIIINSIRLTNNDTIDICGFDDGIADTIKMLLLITKTRIIPRYVMLHKILFFCLC